MESAAQAVLQHLAAARFNQKAISSMVARPRRGDQNHDDRKNGGTKAAISEAEHGMT